MGYSVPEPPLRLHAKPERLQSLIALRRWRLHESGTELATRPRNICVRPIVLHLQ